VAFGAVYHSLTNGVLGFNTPQVELY